MDSVALALFRFFSRTRQKAGAAVRAPGAAPHPHPHPNECNYAINIAHVHTKFVMQTYASRSHSAVVGKLLFACVQHSQQMHKYGPSAPHYCQV